MININLKYNIYQNLSFFANNYAILLYFLILLYGDFL